MLCEELPECRCGAKSWDPGGGTIATVCSQTFKCQICNRRVWLVSGYGCGPVLMTWTVGVAACVAAEAYVNDSLLAQWRTARETSSETPPLAELPEGVLARVGKYQKGDQGKDGHFDWSRWLDTELTKGVQAPEDPIFTHHKKRWLEILKELGVESFQTIPNRYNCNKLEPWYTFFLHGRKVIVGPRKRVDVLELEDKSFRCKGLKAVAEKDSVTFYDYGIHAWSTDKFVEYYKILEQELKG